MPAKVETIDHRRLLRQRFSVWIAFVALAVACVLARQAQGQEGEYVTAPMPKKYSDERSLRQLESNVRSAVSDSSLAKGSQNWDAAMEYYTQYFIRLAAQSEPGAELTEFTYNALKNLDTAARSGSPVKSELQKAIRDQAQKIAAADLGGKYFHPAARINATLLLSNLDTKPADGGDPPVPDLAVGPFLGKKLYESKDAPMGVRVIALSGLRRHSVLLGSSMPDAYRKYYLAKGKELLDGKAPEGLEPESIDPAAFAYVQRYAVDIVRTLGSAEDHKWLAGKLTEIVAQKEASPVIAHYAARNLAMLKEGVAELPVAAPTVVAWADRAAMTLASELKRLKGLDKPTAVTPQESLLGQAARRGGAGGGYPGAMGGGYGGMGEGYGEMGGAMGEGYGEMGGAMGEGYGAMGEGYGEMGGAYGAYGATGAAAAKPQPPEVVAARRRINANLEALLIGLSGSIDPAKGGGGLQAAAKDEAKKQLDDLLAALWAAADDVNDRAHDDRAEFITMLEAQSVQLNEWVKRRQRVAGNQPTNPGVAAR